MNKNKRILDFYYLTTSLQDKIRQGWIYWNVKKERLQSIAEHIYGCQMLAIAIDSEYEYDININRVITMIALHELEEIIIGDITILDDTTKEEKRRMGDEAVLKILDGFVKKEEYVKLLDEFNDFETNDSKFANRIDKLEADIQAKIYSEENRIDIFSKENERFLNKKRVQELITKDTKLLSDLFITSDDHIMDDNFRSITTYAKNNDIRT